MSECRPPFVRSRTMLAVRALLAATAAAAAILAVSAVGSAARGAPPATARDLAQTYFSSTFARAEVVTLLGRALHDYRIDEGRVIAARPNGVDLLECDGTRQTIAVGPGTQVVGLGRVFGSALARGARVVAVTDGGGPATEVRPSGYARALGKLLLGVTLVRAEVLNCSGKTLHDYRIDEGRIVLVRPGTIVLLERDGTRQTIVVSSATQVTQAGQPVDVSALTRGEAAVTIREGDGPAEQILLVPQVLTVGR
jgi:hypothetical protein